MIIYPMDKLPLNVVKLFSLLQPFNCWLDANPLKIVTTLHMKDVKILSHPSADMPLFLWRIRIDRVDGVHLGRAQ